MAPRQPAPIPVGIDLGTTQSAAAFVDGGRTQLVRDPLGNALLPSVVYLRPEGVVVGRDAWKARLFDAANVAVSPKREIGKPTFRHPIRGHDFPPEVLLACLLRELKQWIDRSVANPYSVAVSIPAYFDETRRRAMLSAITMSDVPFIDFVAEPVAAALAFGEYHGYLDPAGKITEALTLLVYDLGGGTFDVTLIELTPGQVRTLGTDGDASLGGQDWDRRIADFLAQKFEGRFRVDPRDDPQTWARIVDMARDARESLATRQSVMIPLEMLGRKREQPLTRQQMELLTEDLLERTMHTTSALLQNCGVPWERVDRLLLAGGATRMPAIVQALNRLSGRTPDRTVNPDEAVARGAAIHAAYRMGQTTGHQPDLRVSVVDVASHSLGMEGVDPTTGRKENKILIPRNTPLPAQVLQPFVIRSANQPSLVVRILEGENTDPSACTCIGHAVLDEIPPGLRRGQPVQVLFDLPRNGSLAVRLRVPGMAEELCLQMQKGPGMTDPQVAGWRSVLRGPGRFATFEDMLRQVLGLQSVPSPTR